MKEDFKIWYIYKITNLINGKSYVGQRSLLCNKSVDDDKYMGSGVYIKKSIKKYGLINFKKETLKHGIKCQTSANIFEMSYIKLENTMSPFGYNLVTSSLKTRQFCDYSKYKMRLANLGKKLSNETKNKISESNKGKVMSDEAKLKISIANKGHEVSVESRKIISESKKGKPSWNKGRTMSEEPKEKIRQARKLQVSPMKGKTHSDEAKNKMRNAKIGKPSNRTKK